MTFAKLGWTMDIILPIKSGHNKLWLWVHYSITVTWWWGCDKKKFYTEPRNHMQAPSPCQTQSWCVMLPSKKEKKKCTTKGEYKRLKRTFSSSGLSLGWENLQTVDERRNGLACETRATTASELPCLITVTVSSLLLRLMEAKPFSHYLEIDE